MECLHWKGTFLIRLVCIRFNVSVWLLVFLYTLSSGSMHHDRLDAERHEWQAFSLFFTLVQHHFDTMLWVSAALLHEMSVKSFACSQATVTNNDLDDGSIHAKAIVTPKTHIFNALQIFAHSLFNQLVRKGNSLTGSLFLCLMNWAIQRFGNLSHTKNYFSDNHSTMTRVHFKWYGFRFECETQNAQNFTFSLSPPQ